MSFITPHGHDAAHRADMRRAHIAFRIVQVQHIGQLIKHRIMAADRHQGMAQLFLTAQQLDRYAVASLIALLALGDLEDTVCFHERGDDATTAVERRGDQFVSHIA